MSVVEWAAIALLYSIPAASLAGGIYLFLLIPSLHPLLWVPALLGGLALSSWVVNLAMVEIQHYIGRGLRHEKTDSIHGWGRD